MQNWNSIGWIKTAFIAITCLVILFSKAKAQNTEVFANNFSLLSSILVGIILACANFFLDKIFRKTVISSPKWNENPFNLKYPLRIYQFFGFSLTFSGWIGYLKYWFTFSETHNPFSMILGIGIGFLLAILILLRFKKTLKRMGD